MGYYYEPLAIVDEETYDAAMWNEVESQKHLNDNMLMPDFDEVDEDAWDDAVDALMDDDEYLDSYQEMLDAMSDATPSLEFSDETPYDIVESVETVNVTLNGNDHKLHQVLRLRDRITGQENECAEVVYFEGMIWAILCDDPANPYENMRLEDLDAPSLRKLSFALMDDIY